MPKLIRITTVPMALRHLLHGQMEFMQQNGFEVIMISADGKELDAVIEAEKCQHIIVPMTRQITPLQDLGCLFRLIRIFIKEKPDIVHTHTPKAGLLGMLAARICFIKVRIHTVAGLPMMVEKGVKLRLLKLIERVTYASATNVWPNSNSLRQFILDHRFTSPGKLNIIANGSSNGVDLRHFDRMSVNKGKINAIKESLRYDSNNTYLLIIGRLVRDKGIVELIQAFKELQGEYKGLRLILAGSFEKKLDPLPAQTEQEIENNAAIFHVEWTHDVAAYMSIADYFVFPSYREGFPNVLLEAGAMELPVICSRIPGNIDIVTDNQTGLVFESKRKSSLKEKLEWAINNPHKMRKMAANLRSIIVDGYDRKRYWQTLFQEYKNLIQQYKTNEQ